MNVIAEARAAAEPRDCDSRKSGQPPLDMPATFSNSYWSVNSGRRGCVCNGRP